MPPMTSYRAMLLDLSAAAIQATEEPIDVNASPPIVDRTTAFFVPSSHMQNSIPPVPSFYEFVVGAFEGIGEEHVPDFIAGMELLGRLAMLAPADGGNMLAHFILPPNHPDAPEEETVPILSLPVTAAVTDLLVNSGCLTGLDNLVYGRTEDGVLFEVCVYLEIRG